MFAARRQRFLERMGQGAVAILQGARLVTRSADTEFPFRQDSDFHYLTGFDHPHAVAVLRTDGGPAYTLFVEPRDRAAETWNGYRPGVEGLVPIACILASALLAAALQVLRRWRPRFVLPAGLAAALLLAVPAFVGYARGLARLRDDTRTLARQWMETNVPSGAFVVSESYGPEPLCAVDLANLSEDLRERILHELGDTKVYAMYPLPMLQVNAEYVAAFYDLRYYDGLADYIVTSSSSARGTARTRASSRRCSPFTTRSRRAGPWCASCAGDPSGAALNGAHVQSKV